MTSMKWYTQSEDELKKLCADDLEFKLSMQTRLAELKTINQHGVRCILSKEHEALLERVLA